MWGSRTAAGALLGLRFDYRRAEPGVWRRRGPLVALCYGVLGVDPKAARGRHIRWYPPAQAPQLSNLPLCVKLT
jgi:hypothetical protein